MKKLLLLTALLLLHSKIAFAQLPTPKILQAGDGFKVWAIEDNYLPIVSVDITFKHCGFAYDSKDKAGISFLAASLLNEGAGDMDALNYQKKLEDIATSIDFSVDEDNFYIEMQTLAENLDESFRLLGLAIAKPTFADDAVARVKQQIKVLIKQQSENPENLAALKFKEIMFANHPYSNNKYGSTESIDNITRNDLQGFIKNNFALDNLVISAAGNIKESQITGYITKYITGDLTKNQTIVNTVPEINWDNFKGKSEYIKKNIPQSVAIFGFPGVKRSDTNFYPAYLMNYILGGGSFDSRLMTQVRKNNGLAYTIYSSVDTMEKGGILSGYVATKSTGIDRSINLLKQEITKIHDNGITADELIDAKDYLINSFPLKMTKNSNLAAFLNSMQVYNLGSDFLQKRDDYVNNVFIEEANRAAYEVFNMDKMVLVIVGSSK